MVFRSGNHMSSLFQKALELIVGPDASQIVPAGTETKVQAAKRQRPLKKFTERELIQLESQIGATLFGPLPPRTNRSFFNLDETTWIWHEETELDHGQKRTTIRYELQDKGVLKIQDGPRYSYLDGAELENFLIATTQYYERVAREIYHRDPDTGEPLA